MSEPRMEAFEVKGESRMRKRFVILMVVIATMFAFASPEVTDVVAKQRYLLGGAMGNEGFRMEDSGLMNAWGGNLLPSVLSPVSASDNGNDWKQLLSYGEPR